VHGVVSGISFYANCLGLPNIGGETVFDAVYQGNPLVNALAVGVMRHEDIKLANATGAGNKVVLFGARTGGDGIGGASILASDTFADGGPTKRPAVQVGDPFAEKVLIECCLELYRDELVEAIQDLGAAGISCATSELAANGGSGMRVDLENVLLRDPTLTPEEILMSESQERMMAIVAPEKLDAFLAVTGKWDVETSCSARSPATAACRSSGTASRSSTSTLDRRRRRPGLRAPGRLPDLDRRPAARLGRRPPRTDDPPRSRRSSSPCSAARTSPTPLGHQPVRLLRHGQHGPASPTTPA
jgi:phosphoribosylformylglycinamidine (FGAM) synthase-like enzyme